MKILIDERCVNYAQPGHPENPARIIKTVERLRQQSELPIEWLTPPPAEESAILRAHSKEHLQRLAGKTDFDADTPAYPDILNHACRAAGAACAAMGFARAGEITFSLMRPPGHHATREQAMGFCYLNSVAIAVLAAQVAGVKRIAVFDFDVHHGNGTEAILLNQPGVAFYSVHQFPCYPGTGQADVGNNCFNFPVSPYAPRSDHRNILKRALTAMQHFKPDLVAVSAGFDAYANDPLAQESLEAEDYHWLGTEIRNLGIPAFSVLEGGYSGELPELIFNYLKGLNGI